jgi:hypothetical protein
MGEGGLPPHHTGGVMNYPFPLREVATTIPLPTAGARDYPFPLPLGEFGTICLLLGAKPRSLTQCRLCILDT